MSMKTAMYSYSFSNSYSEGLRFCLSLHPSMTVAKENSMQNYMLMAITVRPGEVNKGHYWSKTGYRIKASKINVQGRVKMKYSLKGQVCAQSDAGSLGVAI